MSARYQIGDRGARRLRRVLDDADRRRRPVGYQGFPPLDLPSAEARLLDVKITADVGAATWSSTAITAVGLGQCKLVNDDGTIDATVRSLYSRWPDAVTATRFGKAESRGGVLFLVEASCSTIPA